jgi:hypothetical protein
MHELMSIVDVGVPNAGYGYLSEAAFPNRAATSGFFWSTSVSDRDSYTLSTGRNQGGFLSLAWAAWKGSPNEVLCVRRGSSGAMPQGARFLRTQTAQPSVEDRVTGLTFQGCPSAPGDTDCSNTYPVMRPDDAPAHCEALVWGTFDDWRLPTYKELHSVFQYAKAGFFVSGIDEELFAAGGYLLVQYGPLLDGRDSTRTGIGLADAMYPALCVRGP